MAFPSKKFGRTAVMLAIMVAFGVLFRPIEVPDPAPDTVQRSAGALTLEGDPGKRVLKIDGVRIDCGLGAIRGGQANCGPLLETLDAGKPVAAQWFEARTRIGVPAKLLYRLEQDGLTRVSEEETARQRHRGYSYDRKNFLNEYFGLLVLLSLAFYQDRRGRKAA